MICQWDPNGLAGVPRSGVNSIKLGVERWAPGGGAIPWPARSFASRSARMGRSTGGKEPHAWVPPPTDAQRAARTTFQRNSTPPQKRRRGRQQTGGLQADEGAASKHRSFSRADSKSYQGFGFGCRRTIASSAVMSCITACMPARIDSKPLSRSRFRAAVRSVAIAPARLPR